MTDETNNDQVTGSGHPYAHFLHAVSKPARYVGGEHFAIVKPWQGLRAKMALAFPDVYDIGMSHQGTKILYSVVNREPDLCLERAFCPWFDMETELRERRLPLVSLESYHPLRDFDLVGFSLQYELTFTNILTMLDLGGIPLRNNERSLADPLVVAGGPVATQPEPMAPFIDLFLIGDAEERLPRLMRHYVELRDARKPAELAEPGSDARLEILAELAREGGVYCPDLYDRDICERSGLMYVSRARPAKVPDRPERAFLEDINRFPYPDDSPVPVAEAIFDRMAIEIARGCTEGCRFCQAGMIYRPVRERDPEQIVSTLVSAIEKGGYDEAAITSLSTADYSCISPLIKKVMKRLRPKKVSLGISSLRAYGLDEDLLDDISSVKATGLTFAPEAGTQRMRDVVNKNITEEDIYTTCHRVFSRGWNKIKLYFMIGLPSEQDDDVLGIAQMGQQAREIGRGYVKGKVNVIVSVSSHVPKPHTPFQWCAQDSMDELERKQSLLKEEADKQRFKLRTHDFRVSHLEGIIARGDYRTGRLIEYAWKAGARFDGWDEHLKWSVWTKALSEWERDVEVSRDLYLATIPVDGRLPWDHIDVGLAEGFLLMEYKRALKGRFSPPCGKPNHAKVHHTNLDDARADERKLVCYHCGVACDLTQMREERIEFLDKMGARQRPGLGQAPTLRQSAQERVLQGLAPHDFEQGSPVRYRIQYAKTGTMTLRGHLDLITVLPRILRRAALPIYYTEGFSPRPQMSFGPALALGMASHAELMDVSLTEEVAVDAMLASLTDSAEAGLEFLAVRRLERDEPGMMKRIGAVEYLVRLPEFDPERCREGLARFASAKTWPVAIVRKGKHREVDLKQVLLDVTMPIAGEKPDDAASSRIVIGEIAGVSLRPVEIVETLFGVQALTQHFVRTGCFELISPLERLDAFEPPRRIDSSGVAVRNEVARRRSTPPSANPREFATSFPV